MNTQPPPQLQAMVHYLESVQSDLTHALETLEHLKGMEVPSLTIEGLISRLHVGVHLQVFRAGLTVTEAERLLK